MPSKQEDITCVVIGKKVLDTARRLNVNVSEVSRKAVIAENEKREVKNEG